MKELTHEEFISLIKKQGVSRDDLAFICPMCETVQSVNSLIKAGAGKTFEDVRGIIGFNCVGCYTNKKGPYEEKGKNHGCNWSLGGLFRMHTLEVITEDGERHMHFEPATPAQAKALLAGEHTDE